MLIFSIAAAAAVVVIDGAHICADSECRGNGSTPRFICPLCAPPLLMNGFLFVYMVRVCCQRNSANSLFRARAHDTNKQYINGVRTTIVRKIGGCARARLSSHVCMCVCLVKYTAFDLYTLTLYTHRKGFRAVQIKSQEQ